MGLKMTGHQLLHKKNNKKEYIVIIILVINSDQINIKVYNIIIFLEIQAGGLQRLSSS